MKRNQKIQKIESLGHILSQLRKEKQRVVLCHGCFDLVHLGHIRHFKEAKRHGDILVVTLTQDRYVNKGPDRPFFSETHRAEYLASLDLVDFVAINQWPTAVETLKNVGMNTLR